MQTKTTNLIGIIETDLASIVDAKQAANEIRRMTEDLCKRRITGRDLQRIRELTRIILAGLEEGTYWATRLHPDRREP